MGSNLIDRKAAIEAINTWDKFGVDERGRLVRWQEGLVLYVRLQDVLTAIVNLPSVQPKIKPIEYRDCANAILRMWMDNVVTDGEYKRIMDKLNAHWGMKNG